MDRQLMPDAMTFKGRTGWPEEETIQLGHDAVPPTASPPRGRLLFVSHDASRTGAPVALLNILRWLRANDPREMRVILRSAGPLESKFRELAETIVVTDPRSATDLLQEVSLIYSNTGTNGLFLRELEAESIPIITHIHEMPLILESFGRENLEEVIRQTRHYVACSEPVFESLQSHYRISPGMISLVHEGISVEGVLKGASEIPEEQVRQMNRLDQDTMVIAACGVADWRKGPDLFIQLAAWLRDHPRTRRKFVLLWIGLLPGDERGRILLHDVRQLGISGLVRFIGEQENPYPCLKLCDVFCLCSREDPFPLVMLEAAALGKPTICFARSGGAAGLCARGAGFAIPYLNIEAMGRQLLELMDDDELRQKTGANAARLVREEFDISVVSPRIARLIDRFRQDPPPILKPVPPPTFGDRVRGFGRTLAGVLTRR